MNETELKERYGASEHGNYRVIDTVGVPHPYCITPGHVAVAADRFGGRLSQDAVRAAEKRGIKCGICKGKLSYEQHETALLVDCAGPLKDEEDEAMMNRELHAYLMKCKPLCEADKYAGFAFKDSQ